MTTITENVDLPAGVDPSRAVVELQLVGTDGVPLAEAYDQAAGKTIAGRHVVTLDATGGWSLNLAGNSALIPAGTVWARTLYGPQVDTTTTYATVPAAGGPFRWDQQLTDPPGALAPAALEVGLATKVNKAGDTMTGGLTLSGGADLSVSGDTTITGQILTGVLGSPATFGGIQREGVVWPAGQMISPTAVMNFGDGFPRLNMPPDITTDVYMIFEVQEWWLDSTIGVYFEWVNDHTGQGNVRFDCEIKECDIATEALASADVIASRVFTHDGSSIPAPNVAMTSIVASVANGNPCSFDPGAFASFYVLRISRLGADAADTLAGPIGLLAASMTRGQ